MRREREEENDKAEMDFKNALLIQNPELYNRVYEEPPPEEDIEWVVPQSHAELDAIMRQVGATEVATD